jgi:death-on-curing protein
MPKRKRIFYPTENEIIELNERIVKKSGGMLGIINSEKIDEIIREIRSDKYDIYQKASILMHDIITQQPFADGNRRTAYETVKAFLYVNGITLIAKDDEVEITVDKIIADMMTKTQLKAWIKKHSR